MLAMAKVLGEAGRFVTDQSLKNADRQIVVLLGSLCILCLAFGFWLGRMRVSTMSSPISLVVPIALFALAWMSYRLLNKKAAGFEKARVSFMKGAVGEAVVARKLSNFPESYRVINDLSTPFGNLDHVVIGPTGVFILDTKNWKGVVAADGKGELLANGKAPDRPAVKPFITRIMNVKKKVEVLCDSEDSQKTDLPFFTGVLVFPLARVEAKWGATGSVHCVSDEILWDYIVESKKGKVLNSQQVEVIARAFGSLATMDKEFHKDAPAASA